VRRDYPRDRLLTFRAEDQVKDSLDERIDRRIRQVGIDDSRAIRQNPNDVLEILATTAREPSNQWTPVTFWAAFAKRLDWVYYLMRTHLVQVSGAVPLRNCIFTSASRRPNYEFCQPRGAASCNTRLGPIQDVRYDLDPVKTFPNTSAACVRGGILRFLQTGFSVDPQFNFEAFSDNFITSARRMVSFSHAIAFHVMFPRPVPRGSGAANVPISTLQSSNVFWK
jgi:hypothetical protein